MHGNFVSFFWILLLLSPGAPRIRIGIDRRDHLVPQRFAPSSTSWGNIVFRHFLDVFSPWDHLQSRGHQWPQLVEDGANFWGTKWSP